tara:strand:+ start:3004 stop:3441 length:438 start_codon:yes stop_codon:yes gene_type:complete
MSEPKLYRDKISTDSSTPTHQLRYATGWLTDYMHHDNNGIRYYTPETVKAVIKNLHADVSDAQAAILNDKSTTQVIFEIGRMKPEDEKPIWAHSSDRGFWIGDRTNLNLKILQMRKGSVDAIHWPKARDACDDNSQTLLERFEEE